MDYSKSLDYFLTRLEKVRRTGQDKYQACCPAHDDADPSLSIKLADDGKILIHCFSGCSARDVVQSVGMRMVDLFPDDGRQQERRQAFNKERIKLAFNHERTLLLIARADLKRGLTLSDDDQQRVNLALKRVRRYSQLLGSGVPA